MIAPQSVDEKRVKTGAMRAAVVCDGANRFSLLTRVIVLALAPLFTIPQVSRSVETDGLRAAVKSAAQYRLDSSSNSKWRCSCLSFVYPQRRS